VNSFTVESFWKAYEKFPKNVQKTADIKFQFWKQHPFHSSLKFKCVNVKANVWSVRITIDYRALAVKDGNDYIWYWIGSHEDYNNLV
jgi:hypothetical protein